VTSTPPHDFDVDTAELETLGFSPEEARRLAQFRDRAAHVGEYAERRAIERRLEFIQWLVEHGRIRH
jgi:hypothetical protein